MPQPAKGIRTGRPFWGGSGAGDSRIRADRGKVLVLRPLSRGRVSHTRASGTDLASPASSSESRRFYCPCHWRPVTPCGECMRSGRSGPPGEQGGWEAGRGSGAARVAAGRFRRHRNPGGGHRAGRRIFRAVFVHRPRRGGGSDGLGCATVQAECLSPPFGPEDAPEPVPGNGLISEAPPALTPRRPDRLPDRWTDGAGRAFTRLPERYSGTNRARPTCAGMRRIPAGPLPLARCTTRRRAAPAIRFSNCTLAVPLPRSSKAFPTDRDGRAMRRLSPLSRLFGAGVRDPPDRAGFTPGDRPAGCGPRL